MACEYAAIKMRIKMVYEYITLSIWSGWICVCVCVCVTLSLSHVCVHIKARARERERESKREGQQDD